MLPTIAADWLALGHAPVKEIGTMRAWQAWLLCSRQQLAHVAEGGLQS
jgi:hypothetical protein